MTRLEAFVNGVWVLLAWVCGVDTVLWPHVKAGANYPVRIVDATGLVVREYHPSTAAR